MSDGAWPCQNLDSDFWPPELKHDKFLLFSATQFLVLRYLHPRKLIQFSLGRALIFYMNGHWVLSEAFVHGEDYEILSSDLKTL